jgi:hypothetical protein
MVNHIWYTGNPIHDGSLINYIPLMWKNQFGDIVIFPMKHGIIIFFRGVQTTNQIYYLILLSILKGYLLFVQFTGVLVVFVPCPGQEFCWVRFHRFTSFLSPAVPRTSKVMFTSMVCWRLFLIFPMGKLLRESIGNILWRGVLNQIQDKSHWCDTNTLSKIHSLRSNSPSSFVTYCD